MVVPFTETEACVADKKHFLQLLREAADDAARMHRVRQLFLRWQQQLRANESVRRQEDQVRDQIRLLDAALRAQRVASHSQHLEAVATEQQQKLDQLRLKLQLRDLDLEQQLTTPTSDSVSVRSAVGREGEDSAPGRSEGLVYCCTDLNICPCEFPEDCPFNPYYPEGFHHVNNGGEDECESSSSDCFLRKIRLGLLQSSQFSYSGSGSQESLIVRREQSTVWQCPEVESGYAADDEGSIFSEGPSILSSSHSTERRQLLLEVRSLENARLAPRYEKIWKPLRCFRCGGLDHLSYTCELEPSTIL